MRLNEAISLNLKLIISQSYMTADEIFSYVQMIHTRQDDFDLKSDGEGGDLADRIFSYKKYKLQELLTDELDEEEFETDDSKIDHYVKMIKKTLKYPPIVYDLKNNSVIDGTHRIAALKNLKIKKIWAYCGIGNPSNAEDI